MVMSPAEYSATLARCQDIANRIIEREERARVNRASRIAVHIEHTNHGADDAMTPKTDLATAAAALARAASDLTEASRQLADAGQYRADDPRRRAATVAWTQADKRLDDARRDLVEATVSERWAAPAAHGYVDQL